MEDHIVDSPHHATRTMAAGDVFQEDYFQHKETLTKTSRKNILLLGVLANRQLIVQTELAIAIVAAQRAVCLCALRDCTGVFGARVYLMLWLGLSLDLEIQLWVGPGVEHAFV